MCEEQIKDDSPFANDKSRANTLEEELQLNEATWENSRQELVGKRTITQDGMTCDMIGKVSQNQRLTMSFSLKEVILVSPVSQAPGRLLPQH